MFKGTVTFAADIRGNGFTFESFDYDPNVPGVERVSLASSDDHTLRLAVHLVNVASKADGQEIAARATAAALDRLAFIHSVATRSARLTDCDFTLLDPPPGVQPVFVENRIYIQDKAEVTAVVAATILKANLEQPLPPNERYYGLIRSARQSDSPVEEFMHLYNILLMFHNDKQPQVDAFIMLEDATVPRSISPHTGKPETIYTRLRNEFGHMRPGVSLEATKIEMDNRRSGLLELTKKAVSLQT